MNRLESRAGGVLTLIGTRAGETRTARHSGARGTTAKNHILIFPKVFPYIKKN